MWILLIDDSTDYHGEFSRLMKACGVDYSSLDQAVDLQEGLRLLAERAYDFCFIGGKFAEPGVVEAIRASSIPHLVVLAEGDGITLPYDEAAATWVDKAAVTSRMLGLVLREALRTAVELRAARESERLFRMTEEATGIGTWNWNLKTDELTWSPNLYRLFGLQPGEQADRLYDHWLSVMHPDDREAAEAPSRPGRRSGPCSASIGPRRRRADRRSCAGSPRPARSCATRTTRPSGSSASTSTSPTSSWNWRACAPRRLS